MIWLIVLVFGAIASAAAAIGEWRVARRTGQRAHLWGAATSLMLALILTSHEVPSGAIPIHVSA
jgi:hypothetical protein